MLSRTKLVVAFAGLALSLSAGAGIASATPDASAIVNSTCTYPQAALNDQSPETANELNTNPLAVGWLQGLVAAPPDQRAQMVQEMQGSPALQPYMPVIFQVANTCNNY